MARVATLSRSVALFRAFLREQRDPGGFYRLLAEDSVAQLADRVFLEGATVLDVGAGPGWFAQAFRSAGARYIGLDLHSEATGTGALLVRASGEALPVRTGAVDLTFCSNVLEHARHPWVLASELVRSTRPGGTVYLSFTPWYSPWGGHETAPWHYLGGHRARRRYLRRHGTEPKNRYGENLFPVTVAAALRWAHTRPDVALDAVFPRYHPWWAAWMAAVPGLREVVSWNVVLVLRRR